MKELTTRTLIAVSTLFVLGCDMENEHESQSVPVVPERNVGQLLTDTSTTRIGAQRIVGSKIGDSYSPVYVDGELIGADVMYEIELDLPTAVTEGSYTTLPDGFLMTRRHSNIPSNGRCLDSVPNHEGDQVCEHYVTDELRAEDVVGTIEVSALPSLRSSALSVRVELTAFPQSVDFGVRRYCCGRIEVAIDSDVKPDGSFAFDHAVTTVNDVVCEFETLAEAETSPRCGSF